MVLAAPQQRRCAVELLAQYDPGQAVIEDQAGQLQRLPSSVANRRSMTIRTPNREDETLGARLCRAVDEASEAVTVQGDASLVQRDQPVAIAQFRQNPSGFIVSYGFDVAVKRCGLQGDLPKPEVLGSRRAYSWWAASAHWTRPLPTQTLATFTGARS